MPGPEHKVSHDHVSMSDVDDMCPPFLCPCGTLTVLTIAAVPYYESATAAVAHFPTVTPKSLQCDRCGTCIRGVSQESHTTFILAGSADGDIQPLHDNSSADTERLYTIYRASPLAHASTPAPDALSAREQPLSNTFPMASGGPPPRPPSRPEAGPAGGGRDVEPMVRRTQGNPRKAGLGVLQGSLGLARRQAP